jgi:hypothetical protein
MLVRLWWKEARLFWPIWFWLMLVAAGIHWLALRTVERPEEGTLVTLALGWAVLYGLAVGAAAFAGEREGRTLLFLDILPVGRGTLWLGKVSFALASTAVLSVALSLLGHVGTQRGDQWLAHGPSAWSVGIVLFEAVAWGLLWSAALDNALIAGVMAVVSLIVVGLTLPLPGSVTGAPAGMLGVVYSVLRLPVDVVVLAMSRRLVTRRPRPGPLRRLRAIAPDPARERPVRPPSWPALRSLAWQTCREARATWLTLGLVNVAAVLLAVDGVVGFVLVLLTSVVAGVNIFLPEGLPRTQRFYAHHGARPGVVWAVKMLVWAAALLAYLMMIGSLRLRPVTWYPDRGDGPAQWVGDAGVLLAYGFAVGQLCGLVIRRRISAALIAVVATLVLFEPQVGLARLKIIPESSLILTPVVLLAISRAWAGDWMFDQRGAGRWVRLALLVVVSSILLLAAYVGHRAWGVPDIGPPFAAATLRPVTVPPDQDPEAIYRRAFSELRPLGEAPSDAGPRQVARAIREGWDPEASLAVAWWQANQEAIDLTRQGASLSVARGPRIQDLEVRAVTTPRPVWEVELARLMALDGRQRQARGDLAGTWDDILVLLRMGRQMTFRPGTGLPAFGPILQRQAEWLGMAWAADPRQTPELLRSALDDLLRQPANAPLGDVVKVQYVQTERILTLPNDEVLALLASAWSGPSSDVASSPRPDSFPERFTFTLGITPAWERERVRRVVRLLAAERLRWVDTEPWLRRRPARTVAWGELTDLAWPAENPTRYISAEELSEFAESSPLAHFAPLSGPLRVDPGARDRELVLRRALVQVLALRRWQLRHGGRLPEYFPALVPSELAELPPDPYSGGTFGYIRSKGQALPPLEAEDLLVKVLPPEYPRPTRPGQWLLYSVGPDRMDNQASWDPGVDRRWSVSTASSGDITFPLPFEETDPSP